MIKNFKFYSFYNNSNTILGKGLKIFTKMTFYLFNFEVDVKTYRGELII